MSYYPGTNCSVWIEKDNLLWTQDGKERKIPWSDIRLVTPGPEGATVLLASESVLISNTVVWYEFVVEDIIKMARAANPAYQGPAPVHQPRALEMPTGHSEMLSYTRRAQRSYGNRCPNYQEFKAFLEANAHRVFDEGSFYECSMSMCSGSPVGEGYNTDLKIPPSEKWYHQFEKKAGNKRYRGSELLALLSTIDP